MVSEGEVNPVRNILGFKMRINWAESHHLYWSLILMALAGPWMRSDDLVVFCIAYALEALGLAVAVDDVYQHHRQVKDPAYHSPVHNWYGRTLYRYEWVKRLNEFVSKMIHRMGRKK